MESYLCRRRFTDNLKYDWLMVLSLDGAGYYHVTLLELGICSTSAILESYNCFQNFYTLKK